VNEGDGVPFKFVESKTEVDITTFGSNHSLPHTSVSVKINDDEYNLATQGQPCRNNTINFVAFRKGTAVPYAALPFNFQDPRTCGREPQVINSFALTELETGQGDDLIALVNVINMSDSVVMFSIGDPGYASWSSNIKTKLGELGVDPADLNVLQSGEPIIIFGKKGTTAGSADIYKTSLTPANEQQIFVSREITGRNSAGHMSSGLIGPAQQWNQFINSYPALELSDEASFSIYGVDPSGHETLVAVGIKNALDLSYISVDEFPYLRLVYEVKDEVNLTPADWKNWVVTYKPAPEGVLLFKGTLSPQHIQEGNNWSTQFAFVNISNSHFSDSLKVELVVHTTESQQTYTEHFKIKRPSPGDTTLFNVTSSTIGKVGANDINVFVNKKIEPEQYYDNNFSNLPSYLIIEPDQVNPLLQVTIDGREISNGDFVSPTPLIQLTLKDENPFMLKQDTEDIKFFLRYPCNCDFTEIKMSGDTVKWYPATRTSDFRIEFTPSYLVNGEYKLQVNMADASGNWSGVEPYEITFNVMSETSLNYKGVYPNPSSIGFNFSFQLTGNVLPDEFSLEILSTTGQLVSKFGIEDVLRFHLGNNEITWNGNDATGKPLTNGVYIYRLRINAGTEETVNTGRLVWLR